MSNTTITRTKPADNGPFQTISRYSRADFFFAALSMALYVAWLCHFRYTGALEENDLYRMVIGILDGARTGSRLGSPFHYGRAFSFGYLAALYQFAGQSTLHDPRRLIALMNRIGFFAAIVGSFGFWLSTWILYGLRAACVALTLFALSPMMLEVSTSGHPILLAFAFFTVALVLLFLPVNGLSAILCSALGSLLLLAALVSRGEIMLAFPFVVLARVDFRSFPRFLKSAALRSIAPVCAFLAFFSIKHIFIDKLAEGDTLGAIVVIFFRLSHIPSGLASCLLGCGIATTFAGLYAVIRIARATAAAPARSETRLALLHSGIGPLALILPPLAFFLLDPFPARHFLLCLAGIAMIVGWLVASFPSYRWLTAYMVAFGIVLANQALGVVFGMALVHRYPADKIDRNGQPLVIRSVPVGSSWSYYHAIKADKLSGDVLGERILTACDARTLVLTDRIPQVFSHLFETSTPWTLEMGETGQAGQLKSLIACGSERTVMVMARPDGYRQDEMADILAEPSLREYKLASDPDTASIYDKTVIPPDRAAHFGCKPR